MAFDEPDPDEEPLEANTSEPSSVTTMSETDTSRATATPFINASRTLGSFHRFSVKPCTANTTDTCWSPTTSNWAPRACHASYMLPADNKFAAFVGSSGRILTQA